MGGYSTLWASPRVEQGEIKTKIEARAKTLTTAATSDEEWYSLPFNDAFWAVSRVFPNRTDRAGRPRTCVHTVLLPRDRLAAEWPSFNPLRAPVGVFLGPESSLDNLEPSLARVVGADDVPADVAPPTRKEKPAPFDETEVSLALTLCYRQRGALFLGGEAGALDTARAVLDWLPLAYRLKWGSARRWLEDDDVPCQILHSAAPSTIGSLRPSDVLAPGGLTGLRAQQSDRETLWGHLLAVEGNRTNPVVARFADWLCASGIASAPSVADEPWLLQAFQLLAPLTPPRTAWETKLPEIKRLPQLAYGLIVLALSGQVPVMLAMLGRFGQACMRRDRHVHLAVLLDCLWHATDSIPTVAAAGDIVSAPISGTTLPTTELRGSMSRAGTPDRWRYRLAGATASGKAATSASAQGQSLQAAWVLMQEFSELAIELERAVELPLADLNAGGRALRPADISLLRLNLLIPLQGALTRLSDNDALIEDRANRRAVLRLTGLLAQACEDQDRFDPAHSWIMTDLTDDERGRRILKMMQVMADRFGESPLAIQNTRDRLRPHLKRG